MSIRCSISLHEFCDIPDDMRIRQYPVLPHMVWKQSSSKASVQQKVHAEILVLFSATAWRLSFPRKSLFIAYSVVVTLP